MYLMDAVIKMLKVGDVYLYVDVCQQYYLDVTFNPWNNKTFIQSAGGGKKKTKKKLRGLSPRANYTDRAAAAGRRS